MSYGLLERQIRKRLGAVAPAGDGSPAGQMRTLAIALCEAGPQQVEAVLTDIFATYAEGDALRERLSHALRVSSGELYEANRALEQKLGLLDAALDSTPDGVLAVDMDGRILLANVRCVSMWSIPSAVLAARSTDLLRSYLASRLCNPGGQDRPEPPRLALEEFGSTELTCADGGVFQQIAQPIHAAGRQVGILHIFRDLTQQRAAERERVELEAQYRQSQKLEAVGKLAGGIAHDFNNLLTAINGYCEILLDRAEPDTESTAELLEIKVAGERAARLTHQLLAFSRRQDLAPKQVDLAEIVSGMEMMLRRLIGEDIRFLTLAPSKVGLVRADPSQLEQVILNLAVNARDAMADGGDLTIAIRAVEISEGGSRTHPGVAPGSYVCLTVRDTGCGMDEEVRLRAFEPFYTTKEVGKGTGLGLATVYGVVRQSGGTIRIDSALGRGSTFHVYLPRVDESEDRDHPVRDAQHPPSRNVETILVVEDDPQVRQLTVRILRNAGYQVLEADGPVAALSMFEHDRPAVDLMLTDVIMPSMSGPRLYQRASLLQAGMRVLYISGYTQGALDTAGVSEQPHILVLKPFTASALARAVRQALDAVHAGA